MGEVSIASYIWTALGEGATRRWTRLEQRVHERAIPHDNVLTIGIGAGVQIRALHLHEVAQRCRAHSPVARLVALERRAETERPR